MHKVLLSVVLAILMVVAVVGVKKVLAPAQANGSNLIASGGAPAPPIPW
jgi:hypothetical protein